MLSFVSLISCLSYIFQISVVIQRFNILLKMYVGTYETSSLIKVFFLSTEMRLYFLMFLLRESSFNMTRGAMKILRGDSENF